MSNIDSEDFSKISSFKYTDQMPQIDQITPGFVFLIILALAVTVLSIVAAWKIFKKAGEKGGKSIVPVYNMYIFFKIGTRPLYFGISFASYIGVAVFFTLSENTDNIGIILLSVLLVLACVIVLIVFGILGLVQLSKSFGHGIPFTLGLIFFNVIFIMILAFSSSKYKPTGTYDKYKKLSNNSNINKQ